MYDLIIVSRLSTGVVNTSGTSSDFEPGLHGMDCFTFVFAVALVRRDNPTLSDRMEDNNWSL